MKIEEKLIRAYISYVDNHYLSNIDYIVEKIIEDDESYPHEIIVKYSHDDHYSEKLYISRLSLLAFVFDQLK